MHYLLCSNCNKLNLFKTEYLTFCDHCGKKLTNNFPEWKQKNPGKTLDDFKSIVCVTEAYQPEIKSAPEQRKSKISIKAIVIILVFVFVGTLVVSLKTIGLKWGEAAIEYVQDLSIFKDKWEKSTYGNYGFVIESPEKLRETRVELPPEAQAMIADMSVYEYLSAEGLKLYATNVKYRPEVGAANIRGAADGAIANIKIQQGITNVDFSEIPFGKSGVPGIRMDGTANENGTDIVMIIIILCKDLNAWQLSISYPANSETLKRDTERIIESMAIDYNPNIKSI